MIPSQIFNVLDLAKRARDKKKIMNVMFVSPPGLGKTEIVEQWCESRCYQYLPFSLATSDAPDFKGFPQIQTINGRQRMSFALPEMWPTEGKGVIVLEELNRTTQATMQCVLSLGDKRRGFDGYKLPDGWIIVACVNPDDGYDTTAMDHALKDRFEIYDIHYDKNAHLEYMQATQYDPTIINFVEAGLWTYSEPQSIGTVPGAKYVSPRTMSKLDAARSANLEAHMEKSVYENILGINVGGDYYNFCHNESPVMLRDLKADPTNSLAKLKKFSNPDNYKNGMISLTVKDIVNDGTITDKLLSQVVEAIPVEQSRVLISELEFKRGVDQGTLLFTLGEMNKSLKKLFKDVIKYGQK